MGESIEKRTAKSRVSLTFTFLIDSVPLGDFLHARLYDTDGRVDGKTVWTDGWTDRCTDRGADGQTGE